MNEKTEMLHDLCHILMDEMEEVNKKIEKAGGMSAGDLETIDKLSHALKSIKTTIAMIEADDGYSRGYEPRMGTYRDARGVSYNDGYSGRKRDSMGRYSRRGYSYADGMDSMIDEMRGMMADLPADKQQKVQRIISEMERV